MRLRLRRDARSVRRDSGARVDLAAGVAQALTNAFAANLEAHLSGGTIDTTASTLGVTSLFAQSFRNWLAKLFGK